MSSEEYPDPRQDTMPEDVNDAPINYDENGEDPLKRHTKFSWKSFGGDGFIVSVIFHAALIIFALFYVVATTVAPKEEVAEFVSGAGGGSNGENANRQQQRMRPKPRDMATQAKITSKNAHSTLTLPEMPKMNNSTMGSMGGMKAGGSSSGLGGGAGGGIGSGIGPGIGNGRAFLSAFGTSFSNTPTLKGTLYDLKRSRDGKTTYCTTAGGDTARRKSEFHKALGLLDSGGFNTKKLAERYASAKTKLNANQVYVYKDEKGQLIKADKATECFKDPETGQKPFDAPGWLVVYEGEVTPPETGEYRFVGMGDDAIIVGMNPNGSKLETVFYAFWPGEGHGPAIRFRKGWEPENYCGQGGTDGRGAGSGASIQSHTFKGSWMKLNKGKKYKICIAFGEATGGLGGAALGIEQKDKPNADGKISLFKLAEIDPELLNILFIEGKYTAKGPSFMVRKAK